MPERLRFRSTPGLRVNRNLSLGLKLTRNALAADALWCWAHSQIYTLDSRRNPNGRALCPPHHPATLLTELGRFHIPEFHRVA